MLKCILINFKLLLPMYQTSHPSEICHYTRLFSNNPKPLTQDSVNITNNYIFVLVLRVIMNKTKVYTKFCVNFQKLFISLNKSYLFHCYKCPTRDFGLYKNNLVNIMHS